MHIRHNRTANQNIGRGHNCSWFIEVDVRADFHRYFIKRSPILLSQDWIHDVSIDAKPGKIRTNEYRPLNAGAAASAEIAKRDAELHALYVVVPPGPCDEAKYRVQYATTLSSQNFSRTRIGSERKQQRRMIECVCMVFIYFGSYLRSLTSGKSGKKTSAVVVTYLSHGWSTAPSFVTNGRRQDGYC
jgi:hypothetical protein